MKIIKRIRSVKTDWFYSDPSPLLLMRLLSVYVKGDMIVVLPSLLAIGMIGFFSTRFMVLGYALFYVVRGFGEILYWMSQQFYKRDYRPDDFGFKNLDNSAIYIIYQLISQVQMAVGLLVVAWVLHALF